MAHHQTLKRTNTLTIAPRSYAAVEQLRGGRRTSAPGPKRTFVGVPSMSATDPKQISRFQSRRDLGPRPRPRPQCQNTVRLITGCVASRDLRNPGAHVHDHRGRDRDEAGDATTTLNCHGHRHPNDRGATQNVRDTHHHHEPFGVVSPRESERRRMRALVPPARQSRPSRALLRRPVKQTTAYRSYFSPWPELLGRSSCVLRPACSAGLRDLAPPQLNSVCPCHSRPLPNRCPRDRRQRSAA